MMLDENKVLTEEGDSISNYETCLQVMKLMNLWNCTSWEKTLFDTEETQGNKDEENWMEKTQLARHA